ncbi:hypothetical protein CERZMDRAFT_114535 [Cercospora zeae-maydis SCOH1-5]|uniref:Uncharacterized protein n=1 Tax=Cercospora zeae-maydis SCOH1-5 TaxID=717836 RepID=A0A6A6F5J9_9PEZI|nr:hypothetical protein CERZMDRAFT_114535 [Cercospora zeae-maydis SCOH1-5]
MEASWQTRYCFDPLPDGSNNDCLRAATEFKAVAAGIMVLTAPDQSLGLMIVLAVDLKECQYLSISGGSHGKAVSGLETYAELLEE